jgi:geranylgeranyl pyrophosphate synthase
VAADADDAGDVAAAVARTGAAAAARERAQTETALAVSALAKLPQTPWSEALRYIAHELCARVA